MFGSQLILEIQAAHSFKNLLFQIVQLEMIIKNNKKPNISMLTAVTVGSLCPAYTVISIVSLIILSIRWSCLWTMCTIRYTVSVYCDFAHNNFLTADKIKDRRHNLAYFQRRCQVTLVLHRC
jgi:hypothetical protein